MSSIGSPKESYKVGDLVVPDFEQFGPGVTPTVHKITKAPRTAREVNYVADPIAGGRGLKAPAFAFLPFEGTEEEAQEWKRPSLTQVEYLPTPAHGTVVKIGGIPKINPEHLYVVIGDAKKLNNVRVCRLGGVDGRRYWPAIPVQKLTIIPLDRITITPES